MTAETRIGRATFAGSQWEIAQRVVRPALRPHVCTLVGYDEQADGPRCRRQLPGTHVVLMLEMGTPMQVALGGEAAGSAAHPGGFVVGLCDRFATTRHAGRQRGVQVDGPLFALDCGDIRLEGGDQIRTCDTTAWAERGFCSACGTHLFIRVKPNGRYILPAGLFTAAESDLRFDPPIFIDEKPAYYTFANETRNLTGQEAFAEDAPPGS